MDPVRLAVGGALLTVGLVFLAGTRWAIRHGTRPVQQVALIASLCIGTVALIGGAGLLITGSFA